MTSWLGDGFGYSRFQILFITKIILKNTNLIFFQLPACQQNRQKHDKKIFQICKFFIFFSFQTFFASGSTPILFRRLFEYLRRRQLFKSQTVLTGNLLQWIFHPSSQNPSCRLEKRQKQIILEKISCSLYSKLYWGQSNDKCSKGIYKSLNSIVCPLSQKDPC